mmetsp:Transcript_18687/g.65268  ORF Transcript_18687/g.65268 Transcript_18687/m.65268 type:complete len:259 (-) Transcript_18687:27-803(-)
MHLVGPGAALKLHFADDDEHLLLDQRLRPRDPEGSFVERSRDALEHRGPQLQPEPGEGRPLGGRHAQNAGRRRADDDLLGGRVLAASPLASALCRGRRPEDQRVQRPQRLRLDPHAKRPAGSHTGTFSLASGSHPRDQDAHGVAVEVALECEVVDQGVRVGILHLDDSAPPAAGLLESRLGHEAVQRNGQPLGLGLRSRLSSAQRDVKQPLAAVSLVENDDFSMWRHAVLQQGLPSGISLQHCALMVQPPDLDWRRSP